MCKSCPIGFHIDITSVNDKCENNKTNATRDPTKQDSINDCLTCPKGYENNGTDITQCLVCGWSQYQDDGNVANVTCQTCLKNTYITDDRGEFVAHDQENDCVACGKGKFAAAGDRVCDSCPAGKELINSACVACTSGRFSTSEIPTCEFCPTGFSQARNGTPYCLPCLRE